MANENKSNDLMDKLVGLCKRRGFIFQSSEIYGGINGFWDYGPLGVELKRNIKDAWWNSVVRQRDNVVGLDASIIMNPKVWEASGHVATFADPMIDCKGCKARFRADKLFTVRFFDAKGQPIAAEGAEADAPEQAATAAFNKCNSKIRRRLEGGYTTRVYAPGAEPTPEDKSLCPTCGAIDQLTAPRKFNLMFKTFVGASEESSSVAYLRPETAQGIFANYKNVLDTSRVRLPFGIAQIGKAFRNEINPRNFTFRSREFEQMEIEYFCHPKQSDEIWQAWRQDRYNWYINLGLRSSKLRLRDQGPDELAHYSKACSDIEYEFPFGISELEGVANRTDYDLTEHQKFSGKDMNYFDDLTKEKFIPYVVEPSAGVDRSALAFLCEAYTEDAAPDDKGDMQPRMVLKLHPRLAPIKVAVFPLVNKDGMPETATKLYHELRNEFTAFYDDKGAVGRRYRRQDEAGTPFCVTIDGQTGQDQTVTVRDRDSLRQDRVNAAQLVQFVRDKMK